MLGVLLFVGCSSPMKLTLHGQTDMNSGGNAASIRVYQLASQTNFKQASLEAFWRDDEQALGKELIGNKIQVVMYPDQSERLELKVEDGVKYIGVAADLRKPAGEGWRKIYPVKEVKGKKVIVTIGEDRLIVTVN